MSKMDEALKKVEAARSQLIDAHDNVDQGLTEDRQFLNATIGDLRAMVIRWERERDRWVTPF